MRIEWILLPDVSGFDIGVKDTGHGPLAYPDDLYSMFCEPRSGSLQVKRACERSSARASQKVSGRLASFGLKVMKSPIASAANAGSLQRGAERGSGGRSRMRGRAQVRLQCFPVCWRQAVLTEWTRPAELDMMPVSSAARG